MKKSDYAIVVSCTPGYGFGMVSTMAAQNHFGTDADWEIAYDYYTDVQREYITSVFPRNVNWTSVKSLIDEYVVDRRTDNSSPLDRMWLSYWLLAHKLLKEKKYKAVCVIQADEFVFVNLDNYFKMAEAGFLVCSEYPFNFYKANELPFGDDKGVYDRATASIFDAINFIGQEHTQLPLDIVNLQCEDSFNGESNHSVIALNRAVCRHGKKDKILSLEGRLWVCDSIWASTKLYTVNDKVYNSLAIQLYGWHCRWWQEGRVAAELNSYKKEDESNPEVMFMRENCEHNYIFTRDFMERFNEMIPEIKSLYYFKGPIREELNAITA